MFTFLISYSDNVSIICPSHSLLSKKMMEVLDGGAEPVPKNRTMVGVGRKSLCRLHKEIVVCVLLP